MNSIRAAARRAGALYFLLLIVGLVDMFGFSGFMVPGDATATGRNISARELTYRIGILTDLVTLLLFIVLIVSLYHLLKGVDKRHAMLMVLFVSVGVTIGLVNVLNKIAPLILLSGADYLSVFTKPQLDALALGFLRLHGSGANVATAFWGLFACFVAIRAANQGSLIEVVNRYGSYVYGSLLGVFILAILTTRATARGAFWGLIAGIIAVFTVATELSWITYLWYNLIGAVVVVVVGMAISFVSPRPNIEQVAVSSQS